MRGLFNRGEMKFSMRVTVLSLFLVATALTAAVAIGLQYYFSRQLAQSNALSSYREAALRTSDYLSQLDRRALEATTMLAGYPGLIDNDTIGATAREVFAAALQRDPIFYAIYIGLANGNFFELVNLNAASAIRRQLKALPQDRWVIITVEQSGQQRKRLFNYYDDKFQLRTMRQEPSTYLPHKRPWFVNTPPSGVYKTKPYLFQHLQAPGQTYSTRIPGTTAVLAIDIALSSLSKELKNLVESNSSIYLYQQDGTIIATSDHQQPSISLPQVGPLHLDERLQQAISSHPVLTVTNELDCPPFDFTVSGKPFGYMIEVLGLIEKMTGLRFRYVNGLSWPELIQMFEEDEIDILQPVFATTANQDMGLFSQPVDQPRFGVVTRNNQAPVERCEDLAGKLVAIPKGRSIIPVIKEKFPAIQIVEVDNVTALIKAVQRKKVSAGLDSAAALHANLQQYFIDDLVVKTPKDMNQGALATGLHYVVAPKLPEIAEVINLALANITPAQWRTLKARWFIDTGDFNNPLISVPYPQLLQLPQTGSNLNKLHRLVLNGSEHFVYLQQITSGNSTDLFAVISPVSTVLAPAVAKVKTGMIITAFSLLLLVPLSLGLASLIVRPVRNLALENEKIKLRQFNDLKSVTSHIKELDDLSDSLTVMARAIRKHVQNQDALMESFMRAIAQAIDAKSKYTAGHCERVPKLALLLAQAAHESEAEPFQAFHFSEQWQWREFSIGAWLHDCGKISTPEHVVDKGTKLETIYNRIHEIRMRFEVLWRDAEISYLRACITDPTLQEQHHASWQKRQRQLQEDFSFIAACNEGCEQMTPDDQSRIEQLAATTWQRYFDDRLGLSQMEQRRRNGDTVQLPATEELLADKSWHLIERQEAPGALYDSRYGLAVTVPEFLYNLGEIHNLKIRSGTLTEEDRFKISEHVINTIKMLNKLPLPEELQRVPQYASTHHERLDGSGYPRRLNAAELSIPERIIALADIYEALTAPDRPYKKGKSVAEALDILHDEVKRGHLDKDVFELFLTSGIYLKYAEQFLDKDKIGNIAIERYLMV